MKDTYPQTIYLKDYTVPDFLISKTHLTVDLSDTLTTVTSILHLTRNPDANNNNPLVLQGQELTLVSLAVDGHLLTEDKYTLSTETLTLEVPDNCQLECVTELRPQDNTSLEGLYQSSGMYCTQCEAEGFRKITYYLDRPDVMSVFTTKIIADKCQYPVLLSNGNLINQGELEGNRHWVKWHDPFKKPAYLFALVAGDLQYIEDEFTTCTGRKITLRIFVEDKDLNKCDYAMDVLKRSMAWDEAVYGREYDLDIFMIVAVDDFNMGAMENKGLNIFNTSCVLANPEITTDVAFQRVEGVVAHEYFHNWSGNRVTCRDWFQLSLKEGFTVFRDQAFSADMGSSTVKRVEDVSLLRTLQFAEDAGPMAHPVQPPSFIEISNFYTLTVYEKGSEIVRMLHTLLGEAQFRQGSDLYFSRHDGQAVTIDEFLNAMATVSGRDLRQFKYWYTQAGTPTLIVSDHYDKDKQSYTLTITQQLPDTPESKGVDKQALHMPIALGLVGAAGCLALHPEGYCLAEQSDNTHWVFELTEREQAITFKQVMEKPVISLLRGFSSPVKLVVNRSRDDYLRLIQFDSDGFSRWDACQQLAVSILHEMIENYQQQPMVIDQCFVECFKVLMSDSTLDNAMIALMLELPTEAYLSEIADTIDVEAIHNARKTLRQHIAEHLYDDFFALYYKLNQAEAYQPSSASIAQRSLKNVALSYLMLLDDDVAHQACIQQYQTANNMTDKLAALRALCHSDFASLDAEKETALVSFYERWVAEPLVINQWLSVQASTPDLKALQRVKALVDHESFTFTNPNKIRALIGTFCSNSISFHQSSGEGYQFLKEQVIRLNAINPQIASRLLTPLTPWRKHLPQQRKKMQQVLDDILNVEGLSKDVYEVLTRTLNNDH